MAGRKSSVVSGPPLPCTECGCPYRPSVVVGMKRKHKRQPRGLCPRCVKITKAAKNRKKKQKSEAK